MADSEADEPEKKGSRDAGPVAFIRKVGRGKTLARDLDPAEARVAFDLLLDGGFTPAQAGAFLQALRIKELTQGELDVLLDALYARMPARQPLPGGLTLNLASDTARKGGYASLLAAGFLAAAGVRMGVVHSDPMITGNQASWSGTLRMLAMASGRVAGDLETRDAHSLVPELRGLRELRRELGFRSCLHTAEKMLNPWAVPVVLGISHRHYAERMAQTLVHLGQAGKIVLGNHGTPDLVLHKETEVWDVGISGSIRETHWNPADLGLQPDPGVYSLGFFSRWPAELAQPGCGALGPVLRYHLAFLRHASGAASDPQAASAGTDAILEAGRSQLLSLSKPGAA